MHIIPTAPCGPNGLALIGPSRHALMGIRYTEGEGGAAAGAEGAATGAEGAAGAAAPVAPVPAAPAGAAAAAPAAAEAVTGTDAEQLVAKGVDVTGWTPEAIKIAAKLQRDAAKFQQEAGDARIKSKENAAAEERKRVAAELAKILDPEGAAAAEPTVETVTEQLTNVGTERDAALRDAQLVTEAWLGGVDPTKLDYLRFKLSRDAAFSGASPTADDFAATIKASVAAQIAADASLKLTGSVAASGVESLGGANGQDSITQERFDSMSMSERNDLYRSDKATYDRLAGNAK